MTYRIAINQMALDGKLPIGDRRWGVFNDGFQNIERNTLDFANDVYTGHAYAAWHNGRRKIDNFLCAQHIAVDMETGDKRSTLDYLKSMEFVAVYGGIVYTTPSHNECDPRARVVFFLDQSIADGEAYKKAIGFIYSLFPGSDQSCVDCSRFFYGSKHCRIELIDRVLPIQHLRSYYNRFKPTKQTIPTTQQRKTPAQKTATTATTGDVQITNAITTPDKLLDFAINDASTQGRNNRGFRLAVQLKEIGLTKNEAESYMRRYQSHVERSGKHDYTEQEALTNLKSAYKGMTH